MLSKSSQSRGAHNFVKKIHVKSSNFDYDCQDVMLRPFEVKYHTIRVCKLSEKSVKRRRLGFVATLHLIAMCRATLRKIVRRKSFQEHRGKGRDDRASGLAQQYAVHLCESSRGGDRPRRGPARRWSGMPAGNPRRSAPGVPIGTPARLRENFWNLVKFGRMLCQFSSKQRTISARRLAAGN